LAEGLDSNTGYGLALLSSEAVMQLNRHQFALFLAAGMLIVQRFSLFIMSQTLSRNQSPFFGVKQDTRPSLFITTGSFFIVFRLKKGR